MRRSMFIFTLAFMMIFPMVSYAGEWRQDSVGWHYINDDGSYKTGWYQDVDCKWYYFDDTGYMLTNTMTPDGYAVDASGVWIEEGALSTKNKDGYDSSIELKVTAFRSPGGTETLGYEMPATVYYNNEYDNGTYGGNVKIEGFEVSKDGVAYVKLSMDQAEIGWLKARGRYYKQDGTFVEQEWTLVGSSANSGAVNLLKLSPENPKHAEIWIEKNGQN